jgi:hypothetical protein
VPGGGDLPVGVACLEQSGELVLRVAVEPFVGHDQQLACPVERVVFVAAVAEQLLVDPTADLVELLAGQVRSDRGAVPTLLSVRFPGPPPEPGVHVAAHRALHRAVPMVKPFRS